MATTYTTTNECALVAGMQQTPSTSTRPLATAIDGMRTVAYNNVCKCTGTRTILATTTTAGQLAYNMELNMVVAQIRNILYNRSDPTMPSKDEEDALTIAAENAGIDNWDPAA